MTVSGRDNGLTAANYSAVVDLDPPLVQQVLDLLASAGVAAYVEPVEGERGPYQDIQLPERVVVRLQVDRERIGDAKTLLSQHLPQLRATFLADAAARDDRAALAASEVDAAWARIVAGYDLPGDSVGRWSAAEDIDPVEPPVGSGLSSRLVRRDDSWDDGFDDFSAGELLDGGDSDHFVPPPPPPLPEVDPVTRLAWAGVLGGPILVLLIAVLGLQIEPWVILLALLAFCGGIGTLVARMSDRPPHDDGWDDGAVV